MGETREAAIIIRGVKKEYELGAITGRTLQKEFASWWAKKHGKEDPNIKVTMDQRLIGKKFMALNGIDLTIYGGERVGIIGVNGAGKSTLLKLISRITAPSEGEIDIYGRVSSMLEVGTGFHGELTGRENIYLNGSILGMTSKEIDECLGDIIEFSEVSDFIDTPVKRYSSGMFVKLAFAVAAHLKSEIMIMDEVLAVGDMAYQRKCLDKMRSAADDEGKTILYVSHNMNTIRNLCERCIVLDEGRVIFDGDVDKAIAVYMEHSLGEDEVDIDLKDKSRGRTDSNGKLKMTHIKLLDKASPLYSVGENLKVLLDIDAKEECADIIFRATLRTETDGGVGTYWSEPADIQAGISKLEYTVPLESIRKGIFYISIGLYTTDELGRYQVYDHVSRAFKIEILGTPNWDTNAYGYMSFSVSTSV